MNQAHQTWLNRRPLIAVFPSFAALMISLVPPAASEAKTETKAEAKTQTEAQKLKTTRTRLKAEIDRLNKDKTCQADRDCATLEFGSKPCGGPWSYLVYSKKNAKASQLVHKTQDYAKADKALNELEEMMSDCSTLQPPQVKCVKKTCETAAAPAGAENAASRPQ